MTADHIRYDLLAQDALRGVVRRVLEDAAKWGLPGEHHFFISFDTEAPGVRLSQRLRALYPQEMTVVLQHQFWDLKVTEQAFEVGLSFKGVPERMSVPFAAIKQFFDPSVKFGLKFEPVAEEGAPEGEARLPEAAAELEPEPAAGKASKSRRPAQSSAARKAPAPVAPVAANKPEGGTKREGAKPEASPGAEVVRLDRFRKK